MLTPEEILQAYRHGLFPMPHPFTGKIDWFSPDPRGILPLDGFRASHSLRRSMKRFDISFDRDFEGVIDGCGDRLQSWITSDMRRAYVELFRRGHAHSVEAWSGKTIAGGVYGVHVGGAFMAESMFHRKTDAGKAALAALVGRLSERGFVLCDLQMVTPATAPLGAIPIPRHDYLRRLKKAVDLAVSW